MAQLGLFGAPRSPADDEATRALAARLPRELRMGTSSWSFPGWRGLVWPTSEEWSETRLSREGLAIYAQHPLLRGVGIDRSYYGPIATADLLRWQAQLPDGFLAVAKVWEALTKPWVRGAPNPRYLDRDIFVREVVEPHRAGLARHTGALLLEVPAGESHHPEVFARDVGSFLADATELSPFPLAIEVRDRALLTDAFGRALAATGASLCLSYHPTLPPLTQQVAWADRFSLIDRGRAPLIVRLMLPPGMTYEERRRAVAPFDRLHDVQQGMRDDVTTIVARAVRAGRAVFVLVNNKAEGSAPLTIRALAERLARG